MKQAENVCKFSTCILCSQWIWGPFCSNMKRDDLKNFKTKNRFDVSKKVTFSWNNFHKILSLHCSLCHFFFFFLLWIVLIIAIVLPYEFILVKNAFYTTLIYLTNRFVSMSIIERLKNLTILTEGQLTHLFPMHSFSAHWKHHKTVRFSDVFRA